jgi:ParB family chromosome partitioning protein
MSTTQTTTLPLSQLRLDPVNVRKVSKGADPEFVASIKHHGIELPLAVRPNGGDEHLVTDGGKRLAALQALAKAGDIPADFPVPVVVKQRTDAEAKETSLTLNVIRSAMHPVDEYRALAELHVDKSQPLDIDAIAIRFGWPRKQVEQRLALGALDAKILDAWREGKINADTVKAFTLCPEKKAQARLFDKLARERNLSPWRVKQELTTGQDDVGRLLGIVGAENYAARGGKIVEDLFGTDHIVSDPALLKAMVGEKIAAECQRLVAEGWKFAVPIPEQSYLFGHLDAKNKPDKKQRAKLDALRKQIERLQDSDEPEVEAKCEAASEQYDALEAELRANGFTAKQKAAAGCLVGITHDGGLRIDYGRTQPTERSTKDVREQERGSAAKKAVGTISNALKIRLDVQRTSRR